MIRKKIGEQLDVPIATRRVIEDEFKVTRQTVQNALKYRTYSEQAEKIRRRAIELGAVTTDRYVWETNNNATTMAQTRTTQATRTPMQSNFDIDGFAEIVAQKIWRRIQTMTNVPDEWLTMDEVMKRTKLTRPTIYAAMRRAESPLRSYKAGGRLRFKTEDVDAFIAENV